MSSTCWQGQLVAFMYVKSLMNMLKSACLNRKWCLYLHLCWTVVQYMISEKLLVTFYSLCSVIHTLQNAFEGFVRIFFSRKWLWSWKLKKHNGLDFTKNIAERPWRLVVFAVSQNDHIPLVAIHFCRTIRHLNTFLYVSLNLCRLRLNLKKAPHWSRSRVFQSWE